MHVGDTCRGCMYTSLTCTAGTHSSLPLPQIQGLPGTFIANQYVSGSSGNGDQVRTLISFDGGAEWNLVQPPPGAKAADGSPCSPVGQTHPHH